MTAPRQTAREIAETESASQDAGIYDRWGREYRARGPAHLSPEVCEAIERHLFRQRFSERAQDLRDALDTGIK